MNALNIIYSLIIGPIKLVLEVIYSFAYLLTNSFGLSIIAMSLVMNFLLLPLYNKADKIQNEENEIEKKLKDGVDHIKKTFKGDERYMITQAYYRQYNYKPMYSLRGLLPLMLEVPFFIAAYDFLSNLNVINGISFGPIDNLGIPDGLLFGFNLLPILMTVINIISSYIFAKDSPLKTKIQLLAMALFFLFLLYDSPSGLVVYWTLNNIFSLVKNIIVKINNYKYKLSVLLSALGIIGILFILLKPLSTIVKELSAIFVLLLMQLPIILHFLNKKKTIKKENGKPSKTVFILSTCYLSVLTGLLVPSGVINSSPSEFVDIVTLVNPTSYIINSFILASGLFIIWFNIYYALMENKIKNALSFVITLCCVVATVDYLFFGTELGLMNNFLEFDDGLVFTNKELVVNAIVIFATLLVFSIVWTIKKDAFKYVLIPIVLAMCVLSSINIKNINDVNGPYIESLVENKQSEVNIELSKSEKNVVVLFLDRAIGTYFPFLIEEKPELQEQFAGFTYYPNTISYSSGTYTAARVIYGGYEYTPEEMEKRSDETVASKNDEALQVLPNIFLNNDYDVYLNEAPYAGNMFVTESIFDSRIHDYTLTGKYMTEEYVSEETSLEKLNRNLFCYSIMKISPLFIEKYLYNDSFYNDIEEYATRFSDSMHVRTGINQGFAYYYTVLTNLDNIIQVTDKNNGSLLMIYNCASHEDTLLQEPEYIPVDKVDNTEYDKEHEIRYSIDGRELSFEDKRQAQHYQVNMAVMLQLGNWFDYLRQQGVYDNTRIIVVADHGASKYLGQFEDMVYKVDDVDVDAMMYNPLLLYKDFDSNELVIDDSFMTNAEVPNLAMNELIEDDINPFTGNDISDYPKSDMIMVSNNNLPVEGNTLPYKYWLKVNDNIFDKDNWKKVNKQ